MIWLLCVGILALVAIYEIYTYQSDEVPKKREPEESPWAKKPPKIKKIEVPLPQKVILSQELKEKSKPGEIDQPFEKLKESLGIEDE